MSSTTWQADFDYLYGRRSDLDQRVLAGYAREDGHPVLLTEADRSVHTYLVGTSGCGKTKELQSIISQDIRKGRPVCVIDPFGDLYRNLLRFTASSFENARAGGFTTTDLLRRYRFLDLTNDSNPICVNPLEASDQETSEQQVDDLMQCLERLFSGSLEEQRRIRNILRGIFMMTAELNRLPVDKRPALPGSRYPLDLFFAAEILNMSDDQRTALMGLLSSNPRLRFREQYWRFFDECSGNLKPTIIQSSWNVLQYLLDDTLALRFFRSRSTLSFPDLLQQGQSLICYLPIGENLAGARVVGKYILTKLQQASYRRPEGQRPPYHVFVDEFHQFFSQALADSLTHLRNFNLRLTVAHQSGSQPPFDTAQGQALLKTVRANTNLKMTFQVDRGDAESLTRDLFQLTQQKKNYQVVEETSTLSSQQTNGSGSTEQTSSGTGSSLNRSHAGDNPRYTNGETRRFGSTSGRQTRHSSASGQSSSTVVRDVYYSLEGEREVLINQLQFLEPRECYVSREGEEGVLIRTPDVPDEVYSYRSVDYPSVVLALQRKQLEVTVEPTVGEVHVFPTEKVSSPEPAAAVAEKDVFVG